MSQTGRINFSLVSFHLIFLCVMVFILLIVKYMCSLFLILIKPRARNVMPENKFKFLFQLQKMYFPPLSV